MIAYIDENGNLSSTPPDPKKKKVFNPEDMQIRIPKQEERVEKIQKERASLRFLMLPKVLVLLKTVNPAKVRLYMPTSFPAQLRRTTK